MAYVARLGVVIGAALIAGSVAQAQPFQPLMNGGFELANPADPTLPLGWNPFNGSRWRTVGDGLLPELTAAHSGVSVVEETPREFGPSDFLGWSSDQLLDPDDVLSPRNNPGYLFQPGDGPSMTVSGWFMIPASAPIVNHRAGLKLEFRRTENNSVYEGFEWLEIDPANPSLVPGLVSVKTPEGAGVHTDGLWVQMVRVFEQSRFTQPLWPLPPVNPDATVSILPMRFGNPFPAGGRGTIFWDDIEFTQDTGDTCACDWNNDEILNSQDFFDFLTAFFADNGDFNEDGVTNSQDFFDFLSCFFTGC